VAIIDSIDALAGIDSALLDTHIFLWWILNDAQLSPVARHIIASSNVRILVSVASVWEITIKNSKGKLPLPEPPQIYMPTVLANEGFEVLPITLAHTLETASLPFHHNDPFDRILIAQSRVESIPLISADTAFTAYDLQLIP
jgi:PIN domain nuclease of toxin-antitoxin system